MSEQRTPLKVLREARGLSQAAMAKKIKMEQSTYCRIEQGEGCSRKNAEKITKYFGGLITELHVLYPARYPNYQQGQR